MDFFETEWEKPEFDSVPSLAQNIVYLLRDCDDVLVRKMLQEAYRDFCKRSSALRTWRKVEIEDGECDYPLAPLLSGSIDCVTQVLRCGRWALRRGRDWRAVGEMPVLHLPFARHAVRVEGSGDETPRDFVMVETVEIPDLGEERAPKAFLHRYGDAIADGALVRLLSMTGRPWSDMEQARQRGMAYSNALSEARQRAMLSGPASNPGRSFALDMSSMIS